MNIQSFFLVSLCFLFVLSKASQNPTPSNAENLTSLLRELSSIDTPENLKTRLADRSFLEHLRPLAKCDQKQYEALCNTAFPDGKHTFALNAAIAELRTILQQRDAQEQKDLHDLLARLFEEQSEIEEKLQELEQKQQSGSTDFLNPFKPLLEANQKTLERTGLYQSYPSLPRLVARMKAQKEVAIQQPQGPQEVRARGRGQAPTSQTQQQHSVRRNRQEAQDSKKSVDETQISEEPFYKKNWFLITVLAVAAVLASIGVYVGFISKKSKTNTPASHV